MRAQAKHEKDPAKLPARLSPAEPCVCPPALLAPPRTPSHFQGHARATDHRRQPPHSRTWLWDPVLGFQGQPGQEPGPPNSRVTARRQALRPPGVRAQKTLSSCPWSPLPPSCSLKSCLPGLPGQASLDPTPSTPTPPGGIPKSRGMSLGPGACHTHTHTTAQWCRPRS